MPEWFPGAGWKRFARIGKELTDEMVNKPFEMTVESMVNLLSSLDIANLISRRNQRTMSTLSSHLI